MIESFIKDLKDQKISQRQFIGYCKSDKILYSEILEHTHFLDQYNPDILERLYYIINNIQEIVKCKYCENKAIWTGRLNNGYKDICHSKECRSKQLAEIHQGKTVISNNRDDDFISIQSSISEVNDSVIKNLIKYDKFVPLINNPIILDYLDHRYEDSSSRLETVQRIRFGIEEKPKCPTCGNSVVWLGKKSKMFTTYCCNKCRARNEETHKKMKATQLANWGTENCYDSEKYKQIHKEKYGVEYQWQREDVKEKRKEGLIKHYGTYKISKINEIKNKVIETSQKRFGYNNVMQNEEYKKKHYESCKKSQRFGTSKAEDKVYNWLIELNYNVERFVRHTEFPYNVDFYLPDYNVYIEYQGSQYHHGSAFLGTKDDLKEIEELKEKDTERVKISKKEYSQYQAIINIWAGLDVKKRNYAKEHNINYLEIYSCNSKEDLQYQISLYLMCLNKENILLYNEDILQKEYEYFKLLKADSISSIYGKHNYIVKHFQCQNFFKKEIELYANDPIIRRQIIQNRIKYLHKSENEITPDDILMGFKESGIYYGYSHFNPQWTNWFVTKYNIKTIYDPCGGWGHHLLGMLNCDKIIYNDFSKSTVEGVQKIKDYFNIDNLEIHYADATKYIPEEVDGWFMCPPYYNLEHYECGDFESIENYIEFLNNIFDIWKKSSSRIFGIIIREDLIQYINEKPNEIYNMKIHKDSYLTKSKKKMDEKFLIFNKES